MSGCLVKGTPAYGYFPEADEPGIPGLLAITIFHNRIERLKSGITDYRPALDPCGVSDSTKG